MARHSQVTLFGALMLLAVATAKTVTKNFDVGWVMANPDGLFERKVIGINGQWPLPVIEVNKGDRLIVHMHNSLPDKSTSIHFHGMYQNGTNEMDGPSMVTQCPVLPGHDFTYDFEVNQNGTYWYHCHTDYCYPDGYRQALIVHDENAPFANDFEEEFTITVSDWYHDMIEDLGQSFVNLDNPTGAEPIPNAFLFNDTFNTNLPVKPNTTYMLRLINIGAFVAQYFYIEGHTFKIVEIDGVYTEPTEASILYIAIAQRYAILVTTKDSTDVNYPIVTLADTALLDTIPTNLQLNNTNWLEYKKTEPHPQADIKVKDVSQLNPFDDFTLVPSDHMPLLPEPSTNIEVTVFMRDLANGANYAFLNNITYTAPKVPTLYTVMSANDQQVMNSEIYGDFTHSFVLKHNDVVQIVLNNADGGSHPFHLHGHNFQVINREPPYGPNFYSYLAGNPVRFNASDHPPFPAIPARRDTFVLPPNGHYVIRFVADNPGVWMFHCHIDWHLVTGLGMLLIEAPDKLKETTKIPQDHYDACHAGGIPIAGNAAANTEDFTDLTGQNEQIGFIPAGFTTSGKVALAFSCLSAFLGMAVIGWYGSAPLTK